ncbi:MAG: hypothetical protein CMJ81_20995 [Planctomycetaceae bacterium]|nr:hypothetical protein [Planctomycetaceae bacterium]MBP62904.1 hypothetical protein [Planctomycetaceae bacterium]
MSSGLRRDVAARTTRTIGHGTWERVYPDIYGGTTGGPCGLASPALDDILKDLLTHQGSI